MGRTDCIIFGRAAGLEWYLLARSGLNRTDCTGLGGLENRLNGPGHARPCNPAADVDGGHQGERELDVGRQAARRVRKDVEGVRGAPAGEKSVLDGARFGCIVV